MVRHILCGLAIVSITAGHVVAQDGYNERAKRYVEQYAQMAIADQRSSGVPAAVTLGQGILETEAGISELVTKANNHFGIKCKNGWNGPTFLHDDDAKQECFKKYGSASESYADHSMHLLRNPRYSACFKCSTTDYAAWARNLKKCGYATNPVYAQKLIKIIEDFKLQQYTYAALDSTYMLEPIQAPADVPAAATPVLATVKKDTVARGNGMVGITPVAAAIPAKEVIKPQAIPADTIAAATTPAIDTMTLVVVPVAADAANTDPIKQMADSARTVLTEEDIIHTPDSSKVETVNGLSAFYAHKGEMLLPYAVKYKLRYPHLLELNDLPDAPLPFDMYVYLEKKLSTGTHDKHTVKEGETLLMIAQAESMQLKKLAALNLLSPAATPPAGTILELQTAIAAKPGTATPDSALIAVNGEGTKIPLKKAEEPVVKDTAGVAATSTEVSMGVSFTPPAEEQATPAARQVPEEQKAIPEVKKTSNIKVAELPAEHPVLKEETKQEPAKVVYADNTKLPFMKEDPQQPQLKKPATGPEYKEGDKLYIVKRGETAFSIAKKNNITVEQLLKWNGLEPHELKAGSTIRVKE